MVGRSKQPDGHLAPSERGALQEAHKIDNQSDPADPTPVDMLLPDDTMLDGRPVKNVIDSL